MHVEKAIKNYHLDILKQAVLLFADEHIARKKSLQILKTCHESSYKMFKSIQKKCENDEFKEIDTMNNFFF